MESRARFIVVGAFSSLTIIAGFLFTLWIHTSGGLSHRRAVEIEFDGSATGLRQGSAVLFNGVRVGEVVSVAFDPSRPQIVNAIASIESSTPVRADARVAIEGEGLMGATAIDLYGQSTEAPLLGNEAGAKLRSATGGAGLTEEARRALTEIHALVTDNAPALKDFIRNVDVFSTALARNANHVDDLMGGLAQLLGRGPKPPPAELYDLTAPSDFPAGEKKGFGQVVVADLASPVTFETQRVLSRATQSAPFVIGETQFVEALPKLLQEKIVQTFEHAHYEKSVSRPFDTSAPDYQLLIDLRRFDIAGPDLHAIVELSARLASKDGRIVDARLFKFTEPASARDGPDAVRALNKAFGATAFALVDWFDNLKP